MVREVQVFKSKNHGIQQLCACPWYDIRSSLKDGDEDDEEDDRNHDDEDDDRTHGDEDDDHNHGDEDDAASPGGGVR